MLHKSVTIPPRHGNVINIYIVSDINWHCPFNPFKVRQFSALRSKKTFFGLPLAVITFNFKMTYFFWTSFSFLVPFIEIITDVSTQIF